MKRQDLRIVITDDMEDPAELVRLALAHYLERGDRWRSVTVIARGPVEKSFANGRKWIGSKS